MLDQQRQKRFEALRERERRAALTDAERLELIQLVREVEAAEAAYLAPATSRLEQERRAIEVQNTALEDLLRRREALAVRLEQVLAEADTERKDIQRELDRILSTHPSPAP